MPSITSNMTLTTDPDSKLPHIQAYSQATTLVYRRPGHSVDEEHCNHYYLDQLRRIDPEKWDHAVEFAAEQFPALDYEKTANFFQVVLCQYFGNFIEINGVYTGIDQGNGYQYWIFATPKKTKILEIEPNLRQSEPNGLLEPIGAFFIGLGLFIFVSFWIFNFLELVPATTKIYQELKQQSDKTHLPHQP
jgi:hypothetical protein